MKSDPTAVYRALSDETRLIVIALLLSHGELCGCEFEEVLGITQSKTSRHLRYLLNSGLVEDRRVGASIYYRISENLPSATLSILRGAASLLEETRLADLNRQIRDFQAVRCSTPRQDKPAAGRAAKSEVSQ
jgi:ArsR family transcriptional regulator